MAWRAVIFFSFQAFFPFSLSLRERKLITLILEIYS